MITTTTTPGYFLDSYDYKFVIGNSGHGTAGLEGFIYLLKIYNYAMVVADLIQEQITPGSVDEWPSSWEHPCPKDNTHWLSLADRKHQSDPNLVFEWASDWNNGPWVRVQNCNLCFNQLCSKWTGFDSETWEAWIDNANLINNNDW